jgi:hypothetical protein
MEKLLEIISQLRHVTEWSQPNIKFVEIMALINELEEEIKNPKEIEVVDVIVEEEVVEEPIIETPKIEETVVTEEVPKKRNYHFKKKETPAE